MSEETPLHEYKCEIGIRFHQPLQYVQIWHYPMHCPRCGKFHGALLDWMDGYFHRMDQFYEEEHEDEPELPPDPVVVHYSCGCGHRWSRKTGRNW